MARWSDGDGDGADDRALAHAQTPAKSSVDPSPPLPRGPRRALVRYRKDGMRVAGVLVSSSPAFCCFAEVSRAIARAATADVTRSWPGRVVRVPPHVLRGRQASGPLIPGEQPR
jgi:hypothetical protein